MHANAALRLAKGQRIVSVERTDVSDVYEWRGKRISEAKAHLDGQKGGHWQLLA